MKLDVGRVNEIFRVAWGCFVGVSSSSRSITSAFVATAAARERERVDDDDGDDGDDAAAAFNDDDGVVVVVLLFLLLRGGTVRVADVDDIPEDLRLDESRI